MYMRAALLALALGQASALLSSPPNEDKHASALTSPPNEDKHASALSSPPNEDKHASALSSPPNDDKFTVLRALDNAQLMAEVARRNLNACDGAPPQEHRALTELHYSFKYECECDPTPEPTHTSTSSTTAPPSPSPTLSPTVCDYKRIVFKESGKTYHECKEVCNGYGMQMPCIYDKHTDDALGKAMEEANENGGWIALKRFWKNEHYGISKWSWDEHCKPKIDGYIYCNSHGCWGKDEHGHHDEDMYVGYDKDKNNEPNFSGCHARKSTLSGPGWDHHGTWADIKGDCKEFGCFCQPICH